DSLLALLCYNDTNEVTFLLLVTSNRNEVCMWYSCIFNLRFRSIFLHIHFTHSKIMKILNENMSDNIGVIILKKFLLIPVTICLLVIMSSCAPTKTIPEGETEVYEWRMVTHQIPGTARYEGTILPFVEAVE